MRAGIQTIFEAQLALDGVLQGVSRAVHSTMMAQPGAGVRALAHARVVALAAAAAFALHGVAAQAQAQPSTQLHAQAAGDARATRVNLAFFSGPRVPVGELQAFDAVVIDPASGFDPAAHPLRHTVWLARTHADAASVHFLQGLRRYTIISPRQRFAQQHVDVSAVCLPAHISLMTQQVRELSSGEYLPLRCGPFATALLHPAIGMEAYGSNACRSGVGHCEQDAQSIPAAAQGAQ